MNESRNHESRTGALAASLAVGKRPAPRTRRWAFPQCLRLLPLLRGARRLCKVIAGGGPCAPRCGEAPSIQRAFGARLLPFLPSLVLCLPLLSPEPVQAVTDGAGLVIAAKQNAWAERRLSEDMLKSKSPVYSGDVVNTNPVGRLQILFRDNSALTMAPDSRVTINEYVYTGKDGPGDPGMKIAVARGLTRFMSGDIVKARPGAMQVETPRAVLGIHGTIVVVSVESPFSEDSPGKRPVERYCLMETDSPEGLSLFLKGTSETMRLNNPGMEIVIFDDGTVLQRTVSAESLRNLRAALTIGAGGKKAGFDTGANTPEDLIALSEQDSARSLLPLPPTGIVPMSPNFAGTYSGAMSGTTQGYGNWTGAFRIGIGDLAGAFAVNSVNIDGTLGGGGSSFTLAGAGPGLAGVGSDGAFAFTVTNSPPWSIAITGSPGLESANVKGQVSGSTMDLGVEGFDITGSSVLSGSGTGTRQ